MNSHLEKLRSIGLSEEKAKETIKNDSLCDALLEVIDLACTYSPDGVSKAAGNLLYFIASKYKLSNKERSKILAQYVGENKIDSQTKLTAAIDYLADHPDGKLNVKEFESCCGIGASVTPEEIERVVESVIREHEDELREKRYSSNIGRLMSEVRKKLPFADGKSVKNELDVQILHLLGPKTSDDFAKQAKPTKTEKRKDDTSKPTSMANNAEKKEPCTIVDLMRKIQFHKPGENHKTGGYVITPNTMDLLKKHVDVTKGQVRTRFPPEPNGILHIGHAKAVNINFGYAEAHNGICILRFDDTNPEKEEERFFNGIMEMVKWLGYKLPYITHSSDYFDQLYEFAVTLIKKDLAYVCHQKQEEIKGFNPPPSPWRSRPIEESMQLFEDMKHGKIGEGDAILRLKVTLEEGKQDPVAYRIKFLPHHRTGDKWCIYPTYDFTHCLCDSLENITHSLCTKEFQSRRSSYYWLCNALDIYCPVQWEYGRLNMNYTVISKRKIAKLISEGIVRDWDDPRLFTLTALRRRGFPPEAINNFCAELGVTGAQSVVDPQMLEANVRDYLNVTAPRVMAVIEPLRISIVDFPHAVPIEVEVPNFPAEPTKGMHKVLFSSVLFIEKSDYREVTTDKQYRRLTNSQSVGLRHTGYVICFIESVKNSRNCIIELKCKITPVSDAPKPKAFIHWVSEPLKCEIRLYDRLFKHPNPEDAKTVPGGFITDCNQTSLECHPEALIDRSVRGAKVYDKFQFERLGFFSIDPDSSSEKLVFNRTVSLKEDAGKD